MRTKKSITGDYAGARDTFWNQQAPLFDRIYKMGMQKYVDTLSYTEEAFNDPDRTIRCIDERTPGGIHLAGSGILLPKDQLSEVVEKLKKVYVDGVWSHAGCGAAETFAQQNNLDVEKSDEYATGWARTFSDMLHVPYYGHITTDQLHGPADFHIARAAYYIGTPTFNATLLKILPPGFHINRGYLSAAYAQQEAALSVSIATGAHGFGERITKENPFLIVAIGNPNDPRLSVERLKAELAPLERTSSGRVLIDGFTPASLPRYPF